MAQLAQPFDATTVEPSAPRDVIPAGDYVAQIVKSEMVPTKNGNGNMLVLELEILSGGFNGRRVWDRLNLDNPNAQAVEIAQRTLSAICHATGQLRVSDSEVLHFKPMQIKVSVIPSGPDRNGQIREAQNEVKGYKPNAGAAPVSTQPGAQVSHRPAAPATTPPPRTTPPAQTSTPPWRRGAAA